MENLTEQQMFDMLVERGVATEEEIILVTKINGWNEESFTDILHVRTGYRSFSQWLESE